MFTIVTVCFCVGIAIFDIKTYRIPDTLLILFALVVIVSNESKTLTNETERLAVATAVLLLFSAVWYYSRGMGLGDVKYAALLGYVLGLDGIIPALLYTALLSICIYVMGIILFHLPKTAKMPFAPFLSAGAVMVVIGGML
jgi:prepilin signal peptidase PulO-like enzyme (type II secretory pathway)